MKILCQVVRIGEDETIFNHQAILVLDIDGDVSWFHEWQGQATKKSGARITTVEELQVVLAENPQTNARLLGILDELVGLEHKSESECVDIDKVFCGLLSQVFQAGIRYARSISIETKP